MTKLSLLLLLLIALAATAPAAPIPDAAKESVLYFPTPPVTGVCEFMGAEGQVEGLSWKVTLPPGVAVPDLGAGR